MKEFDLIDYFITHIHQKKKSVLLGPGDDAAIIRSSEKILISTDMLVEGTHFRRDWMTPEEIGFKSIRVNISDISAMGGNPQWALVSLGASEKDSPKDIKRLFQGMNKALDESKIQLIGGT